MKLSISPRSARFAALAAVAARVFLGLSVDAPTTRNGAWLSALLGGLLAAPWVYCVCRFRPKRALLTAPLAVLSLLDAAGTFSVVTRSAGYLALDRSPALALLLPTGLALIWCVWRNGDAIGYGAMLWARIAPVLLAITILLQCRYYRPLWLFPLLGNGWPSIIDGGVRAAGWVTAASAVLLVPAEPEERLSAALGAPLGGTAIACALIALQQMMAPTPLSGGWLNRLDTLLCNGRAPLYLQLPMIVLWFAGLFHLLACELFAASALAQQVVPRLSGRVCAVLAAGSALALSRLEALPRINEAVSTWGFIAAGMLTVVLFALERWKGGRTCVSGA